MKYIYGLIIPLVVVLTLSAGTGKIYKHAPAVDAEFNNIYFHMDNEETNFYPLRTTAELITMKPSKIGEYYFNTNTNELWISTGTLVNQFIHK